MPDKIGAKAVFSFIQDAVAAAAAAVVVSRSRRVLMLHLALVSVPRSVVSQPTSQCVRQDPANCPLELTCR